MAVVNKFNVNREQVTLDADIIENMSANDVSYDENTVGDKLSELEPYKETINNSFTPINYYNSHSEKQPDGSNNYLESSQFIEIPNGKEYALVTCIGVYYSYIRLSYYNSSKELISSIKYGDEGVARFIWGTIYALGSNVPTTAKYVKAIARTDTVTWSQVMVLFAESDSNVVQRHYYVDYYDRQINVNDLQEQVNKLDKRIDLSPNFKILNYYDNSLETETADALSSVRIPIPSGANYFLQTCSPFNIYASLGFNFYDADNTLIKTVRYPTEGTDRYLYNSANRCGLGFTIPQNSAYVSLFSNKSNTLFSNMTAMFYASQSDIVVSTDLLFHEYLIAHLKELDDYISTLKEQVEQVDKLKIATDTNTEIIDENLVKQNYYNFAEETTSSSTPDGVSSVKISIPSWANYVLAGYTTKYSYVRVLFYDESDSLIIEKKYTSEDVTRFDYFWPGIGLYNYLGFPIPSETEYIKIGHRSHDMFMFETACVKFYKSIDNVPTSGSANPYFKYQDRDISEKLKGYAKINNWYYNDQLPDYYFPYLSNKAAEIETYMKTCASNFDAFIFITDTHFDFSRTRNNWLNAGWSFTMMSYLRKHLRIDTILHGGDLMNLPLCGNFMEDYKQVIGTNQVYLAFGNHEFISLADQNATNYYTRMLSNGMIYGDENKMWGYVDNPTRKSRYIVLSPFGPSPDGTSSYIMDKLNDDNQYNWFVNTALNIPAGYTAVVVSHILYTLSGNADSSLIVYSGAQRYIDAIDNYHGNGKIACALMGHTHSDRIHISSVSGIPYIISQTDRFYTPGGERDDIGVTRTRGTITEQHFEVVVINHQDHEIKLFAIGSNSRDGIDDSPGTEVSVRTLSNLTNI